MCVARIGNLLNPWLMARSLRDKPQSLICWAVDEAQRLHAAIQDGSRHSEQFGGESFVLLGLGQSTLDEVSFDRRQMFLQRRDRFFVEVSWRWTDCLRVEARTEAERQVCDVDDRAGGFFARLAHDQRQFIEIAWPLIFAQLFPHGIGETGDLPVSVPIERFEKRLRQRDQVIQPLPQWRDVNRQRGQQKEQFGQQTFVLDSV